MDQLIPPVNAQDHAQGNDDAPLTLVEFGDFQCPYCKEAHGIIPRIQAKLGARLRFVFRHLPLTVVHAHAQHAAEAAELAADSDQFWEMHDKLFAHQRQLEDAYLVAYGMDLGLDGTAFLHSLSVHSKARRVQADLASAEASGATGTPSFYVNGEKYEGSWEYEDLLAYLESL